MGGAPDKQHGSNNEDVFLAAAAAAAAPLNTVWNQESWAVTFLDNARQFGVQLMCAGGSGAIAKTAVAPLERAKILSQVQTLSGLVPPEHQYTGPWDILWRMRKAEGGWRVWFRGNGANVIRAVPEVGFKFAVHDQFRVMFSPPDGSPLGVQEKMAAGAATGVCKTLLFYPLDFSRTRITAHTTFVAPAAASVSHPTPAVLPSAPSRPGSLRGVTTLSHSKSAAATAAAAAQARRQLWMAAARPLMVAAAGAQPLTSSSTREGVAGNSISSSASRSRISNTNSSSSSKMSTSSIGGSHSSSHISSSSSSSSSSACSSTTSSRGRGTAWAPSLHRHMHGTPAAASAPLSSLPSAAAAAAASRQLPQPCHAAAVTRGVIATLRDAIAREGVLSVYKGMSLSLPGVVIYTSVSFTAYDHFKHLLPSDKNTREAWWYPFAKMGCGAAAGVAAQTCSYPLDTLRRRMQMTGATAAAAAAAAASAPGPRARRPARVGYGELLSAMAARGAERGGLVRALFRGWSLNCVKIVPGAAVQFVAYDALRVGVTWLDPTSGAQSPL